MKEKEILKTTVDFIPNRSAFPALEVLEALSCEKFQNKH